MPTTFSACARQTYDVSPLEIAHVYAQDVHFVGVCSLNCTQDVHFVGVCSLNCTRAYYARVQSLVHVKNTHALTVYMNCTRVFRHVYLDMCMTLKTYHVLTQ